MESTWLVMLNKGLVKHWLVVCGLVKQRICIARDERWFQNGSAFSPLKVKYLEMLEKFICRGNLIDRLLHNC